MTTSMIITLAIVVLMIVVIISDKLPFGAPALLAAAALVVTGQADVATAFSGFTDKNVIMIMGFFACMAALQKTKLIHDLKRFLGEVASKGGILGFALLILAIMAIGNFISGTAYYVLVITIISSIPYNSALPTSRILIPATWASGYSGWLPNSIVFYVGLASSLIASATGQENVTIDGNKMILMNIIWSAVYLVYAVVMHKVLPDRDIADGNAEVQKQEEEFTPVLKDWQQTCVYVLYALMLLSMVFQSKIPGEIAYGIPLFLAGIMLCVGALNFKEVLNNMFSPVMIMMASVIGVAAAMGSSGLSAFLGEKIAALLGGTPSNLVLVLVFSLLTSIFATLTGASIGSIFIFAPVGAALCVSLGYSAVPLVLACVKAGWINWFLPIDGMPALAMGVGKYKLTEFWKYILPLWLLQMVYTAFLMVAFYG